MLDDSILKQFRYISLTGRDISAQAVSLYKATATQVFHTNVEHSDEAKQKLLEFGYNYDAIDEWYMHIRAQELGWQKFFYENKIFPLYITYEDIEEDVLSVAKRIATFIGVNPSNVKTPDEPSVFRKVSDDRNFDWARRYEIEKEQRKRSARSDMGVKQLMKFAFR